MTPLPADPSKFEMEGNLRDNGTPPMQQAIIKWTRIAQTMLDKTTIYPNERWVFFMFSLVLYSIRVHFAQGFYIISYALGIFLLNLVIGFLSPAIDPEEDEDGPVLPTSSEGGEFRPFTRKLPEFKFWLAGTKAVWICLLMTCFRIFDLPVFWPILLMYFILLVFITMKDRVRHMIKHQYVPWDFGKKNYNDVAKVDLSAPQVPSAKGK